MSQLIQKKVGELSHALNDFTMQSDARILHLCATDDDYEVAYHYLAMLAQRKLECIDLIVWADMPFEDTEQYADDAVVAFCEAYDRLEPLLPVKEPGFPDEKAVLPAWNPEFISGEEETGPQRLNRLVQDMVTLYGDYFDKIVFLFIPPSVTSTEQWNKFMIQFVGYTDHKVRLAVIDNLTPFVSVLEQMELTEKQVYPFSFAGQSYDMMLDVLDGLKNQDEIVDYQRHLTQAFQFQSKQNAESAMQSAQAALNIAQQQQIKDAQIVAMTTMYAISVGASDYEQAQQHTQRALAVAKTIQHDELPVRDQIEAVAYANLATAQLLNRYYDLAAENYYAAAGLFRAEENQMMAYENMRMSVLCLTQIKQYDEAWMRGADALVDFYQTPEPLWPDGTLAYLGKNMMQISDWQSKAERRILQAHLADLLGEAWQQIIDDTSVAKLPPQRDDLLPQHVMQPAVTQPQMEVVL